MGAEDARKTKQPAVTTLFPLYCERKTNIKSVAVYMRLKPTSIRQSVKYQGNIPHYTECDLC